MGLLRLFRRRPAVEARSVAAAGFTAQVMAARAGWLRGASGVAELTATVQGCVSLWEGAFASADVEGTGLLTRPVMAMAARSLALRGEFVALIREDRLVPVSDWDVSTVDGAPRAYRASIAEAGGSRSETVLAAEVLHVRVASDPFAPWAGQPPLKRAALSAQLLHEVEAALGAVWQEAPIGSQVLPLPDGATEDMARMRQAFAGRRGGVLVVEGVAAAVAAGQHPQLGQKREDLTPGLREAEATAMLAEARASICHAFGVLPVLLNPAVTGPAVREAQRHLAQWTLEPLAKLMAAEASEKLGQPVRIDVVRPLQAYDAGGKARALAAMIEAMAAARERGLTPGEFAWALHRLDLE